MPHKGFKVVLTVTKEHTYFVEEANTTEEAEGIAEVMYEEGDEGDPEVLSNDVTDSYPVEQ